MATSSESQAAKNEKIGGGGKKPHRGQMYPEESHLNGLRIIRSTGNFPGNGEHVIDMSHRKAMPDSAGKRGRGRPSMNPNLNE